MHLRARLGAVVVLAATAAACGGGSHVAGNDAATDGASETGAAAPLTATEFCNQFYDRAAAFNVRCNGGAKADWVGQSETFLACADVAPRIAAGRLTYHPELAQACLDGADRPPSCLPSFDLCFAKTLAGTSAYGAPCLNDYDCPFDGLCGPPGTFGFNACEASVCQKIPATVGDSCAGVQFCFGSSCLFDVCMADLPEGADCSAVDKFCGGGLFCDAQTTKCTAPRGENGACDDDLQCLGTLFCATGKCKPRLAPGAACTGAETGCPAFTLCDPTTLRCEPAGRPGQPCGFVNGAPFACIGGVCTTEGGFSHCEAPQPNGAGCFFGDQCQSKGCNADNVCATCN